MSAFLELLPECECTPAGDEERGFGALSTPGGNLPLKLMDVRARVTGLLVEVELRQTYVNTLGVPLEATYMFPLPDRAAVHRFRLEVGDRVIEGDLQERGQARQTYDRAIRAGHRAAIAEEERAGVFTMRVGNVMPGEEATVWLTLSGPLSWSAGEATFQFPLVVAPRYIPGTAIPGEQVGDGVAHDTDAVPDASRISPPVLLPGYPNPVRLSLEVELDPAGLVLGRVRSSLHAVTSSHEGGRVRVRLQAGERLNRDFILRFALQAGSSFAVRRDPERAGEGTFLLTLVPPDLESTPRPRDVVVVLDRSGSMEGWKMVAARRAAARLLDSLTPRDRFALLAFDDRIESPFAGQGLVEASDRQRFRAVEFLAKLDARGGTEMAAPLTQAARMLGGAEPRERVLVLVTDGQVGNEDQILRGLARSLHGVRPFTLGIDRAVNAAFLRRLAGLGQGQCELVESEDRLDEVMAHITRAIGTPVVTGLRLVPGGFEVEPDTIVPDRLPDLLLGAPVLISGRLRGAPGSEPRIEVHGRDPQGHAWYQSLAARPVEAGALDGAWARGLVRQLEDRYAVAGSDHERSQLEARIVAVSLRQRVLCRFTAFVAVDRAEVVNEGGRVHRVTQAVEQPEGWGAQQECESRPGSIMPRASARRSLSSSGAFGSAASDPFMDMSSSRAAAPEPFGALGGGGADPFAAAPAAGFGPPPGAMPSSARMRPPASDDAFEALGELPAKKEKAAPPPPRVSRSSAPAPMSRAGKPRPPAGSFADEVQAELEAADPNRLTRDGAMVGSLEPPLRAAPRQGLLDKLSAAVRGKAATPAAEEQVAALLSELRARGPLGQPADLQALVDLLPRLEVLVAALRAQGADPSGLDQALVALAALERHVTRARWARSTLATAERVRARLEQALQALSPAAGGGRRSFWK